MARRQRDYREEERRRNERARVLGYENRYKLRKALSEGTVQPTRYHGKRTGRITRVDVVPSPRYQTPEPGGFEAESRRVRSEAWSEAHSRRAISDYGLAEDLGPYAQDVYFHAFVERGLPDKVRKRWVKEWMVDVTGYMTEEQWKYQSG